MASFVAISHPVIATLPIVSLKLSNTVFSGAIFTLYFSMPSAVIFSLESKAKTFALPISEIDSHLTSSGFSVNQCDSFLGGVLPMEISKISCISLTESEALEIRESYSNSIFSSKVSMIFSLFSMESSILPRISTISTISTSYSFLLLAYKSNKLQLNNGRFYDIIILYK